jgi:hypothetical protein
VRRVGRVRGVAALVAVLGTSLLLCADASATTTSFTSTPPSAAVAGGSYEVSATRPAVDQTPERPVAAQVAVQGACSFTKPEVNSEQRLPAIRHNPSQPELYEFEGRREAPQTVYFVEAGKCRIRAYGTTMGAGTNVTEEEAEQVIQVGTDPSERIAFTSTAPGKAAVAGSYDPSVRSSAGVPVEFSIATRSVCRIGTRHINHYTTVGFVSLIAAGTCTIDARQNGVSESEPPEAKQSFEVSATTSEVRRPPTTPKKPSTKKHRAQCPAKKCATLIVHVYSTAGRELLPGEPLRVPDESARLRITQIGPRGSAPRSWTTSDRTMHVVPGRYEIAFAARTAGEPRSVTMKAGQTLEVTLTILVE